MASDARHGRWYHGWNIVAMCVTVQAAALGLTMNCFSLFLPDWTRQFGVPVSGIAIGITLFSLGTILLSYLIGLCAGRYPARWLFGGGLVALAAGHLLVAMTSAAWQILLIYTLLFPVAIGFSGSIPSQSLVSRWFVRRAGLAMGLTAFGIAIGGVLLPPVIVMLLPVAGWRLVWGGMAALILLVVLPLAMRVLRDRPDADDPFGYVRVPGAGAGEVAALPFRAIVRRRNFWVVMVAFLSVQLIALTVSITIAPILLSYGATRADAGMFVSIFSMAALASKLASGWMADRVGNGVPLVAAALGAGSGALLLAIGDAHPLYLVGVAIMTGLTGAVWTLLASAMLAEFGSATFGRAFGFACALSPLATLAPPLVARAEELSGSYVPRLCKNAQIWYGFLAFREALRWAALSRGKTVGRTIYCQHRWMIMCRQTTRFGQSRLLSMRWI